MIDKDWLDLGDKKPHNTGVVSQQSAFEGAIIKDAGEHGERMIKLSDIHMHPFNRQREYDDEHIHELAQTISSEGHLHACIVRDDGDGFLLLAGHYRYLAIKELGLREIKCIVKEKMLNGDPRFYDIRTLLSDNVQKEMSFLDKADMVRLLKNDDWTNNTIASLPLMGTEKSVQDLLAVWDLPKRLLEAVKSRRDVGPAYIRVLTTIGQFGREACFAGAKLLRKGGNRESLIALSDKLTLKAAMESQNNIRTNAKKILFSNEHGQVGVVRKTHYGSKLELECSPEIISQLAEMATKLVLENQAEVESWCRATAREKEEKNKLKRKLTNDKE